MAAPASVTIKDLSGTFYMNKTLSDDPDPVLALQGVSWITRSLISLATVYLNVKQYKDDAGVVHIDIDQVTTGGLQGTTELRTLDWEKREHEDHIFGKLHGQTRFINTDAIEDAYLKEGWLEGDEEKGGPEGELHIQSHVEAVAGWTADMIWGFAEIDGERRYTRRVVVTKGDQVLKVRLIYDYYVQAE
ncbi:hypothetical protein OIDMADRAFT_185826 [Oidiodendron maius Zn]|uniref:LCCL domain-containing protein n=1 Tax=Oidiodendron maius (strain Zn) TaxID=913774 RepID=A0A0C3DZ08_OIDMZ|nr:hypothetical protein OIDMADRAFT_185826 [Oidiodendron maius Zn]